MASANTLDIPSSRDRIDCNNLEMELSVLRSNAEPLSRLSVSFYDREITRNGGANVMSLDSNPWVGSENESMICLEFALSQPTFDPRLHQTEVKAEAIEGFECLV